MRFLPMFKPGKMQSSKLMHARDQSADLLCKWAQGNRVRATLPACLRIGFHRLEDQCGFLELRIKGSDFDAVFRPDSG